MSSIIFGIYSVSLLLIIIFLFVFNDTATTEIYTLSLHDALPISGTVQTRSRPAAEIVRHKSLCRHFRPLHVPRSEEHTSELQSRFDLVCRLLLEKKKKNIRKIPSR